jgi:hypothetical protein
MYKYQNHITQKLNTMNDIRVTVLFLFQFFSITLLFAQAPLKSAEPDKGAPQFPEASAYANADLTCNIIDAPNNTFCYNVYAGGRLMIHQTSVPGIPGNEGFKTKDDALKVADMVMYKIRKGEMPPTVTLEEMKELGVIK